MQTLQRLISFRRSSHHHPRPSMSPSSSSSSPSLSPPRAFRFLPGWACCAASETRNQRTKQPLTDRQTDRPTDRPTARLPSVRLSVRPSVRQSASLLLRLSLVTQPFQFAPGVLTPSLAPFRSACFSAWLPGRFCLVVCVCCRPGEGQRQAGRQAEEKYLTNS